MELALSILGMPVTFRCDGPGEAAAVREACRAVRGPSSGAGPGLHIDLTSEAGGGRCAEPRLEVKGSRLLLASTGAKGYADAAQRSARCSLQAGCFAHPSALFAHVIEPLVLFLATRNGRVPLHAAAVMLDGFALVLAGSSGSGKSSLAFAAHRAGLPVLSEDLVLVQPEPDLALWGWGERVHLFPADAVGGTGPLRWRNGKCKVSLGIEAARPGLACRDFAFCLLEHGSAPSLRRMTCEQARGLLSAPESGFDLLSEDICALTLRFIAEGAWLLTLSADPDEAIALLVSETPRLRAAGFIR